VPGLPQPSSADASSQRGCATHTSSVDDLRTDYQKDGSPVVGPEFVAPPATSPENLAPERCDVTRSQLRADFRYVTTIQQPQAEPMAGTSWVVESGKPGAQQA
jgi:hypothetical protein